MEKQINSSLWVQSSPVRVPSESFREAMEDVRGQIDIECFGKGEQSQARELMLIIAEIYSLPPTALVQICGEKLTAGNVREVYSMLDEDHLRSVMESFNALPYRVRSKKMYLRTALYNEVFEHECRVANEFSIHFPEFGGGDKL